MKTKILFIALFAAIFTFAQEQVKFIKKGTLTLTNNEKIEFNNLVYEKDKVMYTNLKNQAKEHLYLSSILSIDEGQVEMIDAAKIEKFKKDIRFEDGVYYTLDNLIQNQFKSGDFSLVEKNSKRNFYYLEEANGKKNTDVFAYVLDGKLYIRGAGIKKELTKKSGLTFNGNRKIFVEMEKQGDLYVARTSFSNNAISIPGAVVSGVVGGILAPGIGSAMVIAGGGASLFSLMATSKKEIVLDYDQKELYLR